MSTNQIPNLNTLRRAGGGLRGRLRGRGRGGSSTPSEENGASQGSIKNKATQDKIIQGTDVDASVSRLSAVELGYLDDMFAKALTPPSSIGAGPPSRRFPIINRGTYVRTTAIDELVDRFLEEDVQGEQQYSTKKQIISLGAGSDTRAFRLFSRKPSAPVIIYHEIDFSVNTLAKIRAIRSSPLLQKTIQMDRTPAEDSSDIINITDDALHLPNYHIHPIDLRTLAAESDMASAKKTEASSTSGNEENQITTIPKQTVTLPGVDPSLPTLLISECCLIYLSPNEADTVIDYFSEKLFPPTTPLGLIIYEPVRPDDPFGKTMVSNLAARGIQLQTLHKYSSLAAQRQRFLDHGLQTGQGAVDIDFIWNHWIHEDEKERVAALEMLDEIEEWKLLAQHYCVSFGWRNAVNGSDFASWNRIRKE